MSFVDRRCGSIDYDVLSLAFEASGDCIKMLALDGTLLAINAGGATLMGFDCPDSPVGRNWLDLWPGEDRARAGLALEAARRGQRPVLRGRVPTARGTDKYWDITILPVPGMDGLCERFLIISRDVTEKHEAERALQRSTRLYQALIEAASEIVWHFDMTLGTIERRGHAEFTGHKLSPNEAYGWVADVHPDDVGASRHASEQAASTGKPYVIEYRLRHKSGGWRWVEDRAQPIVDHEGVLTDWIGMITDIHDRKSAEQALRQSEERLRLAVESADLGTWDLDVPTGEREWSDEAKRMFGLAIGTTIVPQTLLDLIHPDDKASVEEQRHINRGQLEGTTRVSFRAIDPQTGKVKWIVACGRAVLDDQGNPMRRVGTFLDYTERKLTQDALGLALRRHEALLRASSDIVWYSNPTQEICGGRGWAEFTGRPHSDANGIGWLDFIHPDDLPRVAGIHAAAMAAGVDYTNEYRMRHISGQWRWVADRAVTLMSDDGSRLEEWAGTITDIHDRKVAETALQKSEEHLRLAIDATALGTWDVNLVTGEREWSPEFFDLLDLPRDTRPDRPLFLARIHPDDRARIESEIDRDLGSSDCSYVSVFRLLLTPGVERWVERHERLFFDSNGVPIRRVGSMRDISDRRQAEQDVWMAAHTDALTGVANRALFQTRLDQAVEHATREGLCVGLFIVDLDRFKDVNDSLGHDAGDILLRSVADRLRDGVPEGATVARLGGDEFGVIVPAENLAALDALPARLLAALRDPVDYMGRDIDPSVSIGWSVYPDHDRNPESLLKYADVALYAVKAAGRGHARAFTPTMLHEMERRVNVLRCAKDALIRDAVFPFYQPKVSLRTGRIVGFEALLRWTDETGLRTPGAIQEALDDPELSIKLGARMLERVVVDMRAWKSDGLPFGHVAVNVAAPEFFRQSLADRVLDTLGAARLSPCEFEIEITERVLLDGGLDVIGKALKVLGDAGVAIALDDFGTGYASLTHLKKFPVSWLKIDRSFISTMERDVDSAAIVSAVTHLAHNIGIKVVAEGIETRSQWDAVQRIGCDLGQGYLMARPVAASRVPSLLAQRIGFAVAPSAAPILSAAAAN